MKLSSGLEKHELVLWIFSVVAVSLSFILSGNYSFTVLAASLTGVTALIFVAKGEPLGQILTLVFSVFYGIISYSFRYYGEMITYLGMTSPIAAASVISWYRHPFRKGRTQVAVESLTKNKILILIFSDILTTAVFYFILEYFDTPNLFFSTLSVSTSFAASYLTLMRSPFYGIGYAMNDIILIILWISASLENPSYIPMTVCFVIFLINDCYGFFNWMKIRRKQKNLQISVEKSCF